MRRALILLSSLALAACASDPYWVKTWEGAREPVEVVVVDRLASNWTHVHGWTVCDKAAGRCTIYVRSSADRACIEAHERRHAAGWDHPDYPVSFACTAAVDVLGAGR
jgi:hypothetical protein